MTKLVRDKIPDIINARGISVQTYIANDQEFRDRLKDKLLEECREFVESDSPEELADILEVVDALKEVLGVSEEDLAIIKKRKLDERGGFEKRIVLGGIGDGRE